MFQINAVSDGVDSAVIILLTCSLSVSGVIQSFYVTNGVIPIKRHAIQLTCQINGNIDHTVKIALKDHFSNNEMDKCNCFGTVCLKYNDNGHSCGINGTTKTVSVNIQQAKAADEGVWICLTDDNGSLSRKSLTINLYGK